ncbi:MAG TPA: hypothetical protein ENK11_00485 [Phycisphaerales bacterium]|nr:hypothetical protein [Phycisphaerales bacterium]
MSTEIDKLRRENRMLRAGVVLAAGLALAGVMIGMGNGGYTPPKPVSITSDGEHLFKMMSNGQILVLAIEDQLASALRYEENRRNNRGRRPVQSPRAHWITFVDAY